MEVGTNLGVNCLINSLLPMTPYGVMVFHEPIRVYMEGLLLGVNPLSTIGNSLKNQKSLYKVSTPSINSPI